MKVSHLSMFAESAAGNLIGSQFGIGCHCDCLEVLAQLMQAITPHLFSTNDASITSNLPRPDLGV